MGEHPVVGWKSREDMYDLDDAMHDSGVDHMSQGDLDSYYLFKGFLEESIRLDENKDALLNNPDFDFKKMEPKFRATHNLITAPIRRIMMIQQKNSLLSKRSEFMKEFRIIGALAHVMMEVPDLFMFRVCQKIP